MITQSRSQSLDVGGWLLSTARNNPEGLLLLAAGAALLVRSATGSRSRDRFRDRGTHGVRSMHGQSMQSTDWGHDDSGRDHAARTMERVKDYATDTAKTYADQASRAVDGAKDYLEGMRDYAGDLGANVADTASAYASSASQYANKAARTVSEQSSQFVEGATSAFQDTAERVLREQPLAVVVAGLAAGAAVAAAFPPSDIERRTLGPVGEGISDFASGQAVQLKTAGIKAGEQLMASAEERGLTTDGVKQMAQEAVETFGSTLSERGRPEGERDKVGAAAGSSHSQGHTE